MVLLRRPQRGLDPVRPDTTQLAAFDFVQLGEWLEVVLHLHDCFNGVSGYT